MMRLCAKLLVSACILTACAAPPAVNSPANQTQTPVPEVKPTPVAASLDGVARLDLKGSVLLPSGVRQDKAGILLPSGVLLPSGILLPSGFHSQAAETASAFSDVIFQIKVYDQTSGELLAETYSDGSGAYLLKDLPAGAKLRIEAQAVNLDTLVLQALADLPTTGVTDPVRNISSKTTAAVLLAQELGGEVDVPSSSLQNSQLLAPNLDTVAEAVDSHLGLRVIRRLADILDELKSLISEVKALIQQQQALLKAQTDQLQDRSFQQIDPSKWTQPTTQLGNYPALPDGTCPKAPPHPDGTPGVTPTPDPNGQCPPPPSQGGQPPVIQPSSGSAPPSPVASSQPQGNWPTSGPPATNGICPPPQGPPGAPLPPTPTPYPNGFCPPPGALGLPPQPR